MNAEDTITSIEGLIAAYRTPPPPPPPKFTVVGPSENLQAAIDAATLPVHLVAGETYGPIRLRSETELVGNGAFIVGVGGPAVRVPAGTGDINLGDVVCTARDYNGPVVLLGENSATTQGTEGQVPVRLTLTRVSVPTHRGKRAFEINAADVQLWDCEARDVYTTTGQDSQAIAIMNTPGRVSVFGGYFEAGSENIMIGGDTIKIPNAVQSDLLFDGVTLVKPESWKTDGIKRAPKNLFEVKAGRRVTLRNSTLSGSWKSPLSSSEQTQEGYAIVITPKNSNYIEGVTIENCAIDRVGGGIQLLGKDYNTVTPQATSGVVVRNSHFNISRAAYFGRGVLAVYVDGMLDSLWENVTFTHDGPCIVVVSSASPTGTFTMRGCDGNTGPYGVMAPGANYGNVGYAGREFAAVIEGNVLNMAGMGSVGQTAFKKNFPNNTW